MREPSKNIVLPEVPRPMVVVTVIDPARYRRRKPCGTPLFVDTPIHRVPPVVRLTRLRRIGLILLPAAGLALTLSAGSLPALNWRQLPPLPDPRGFASPLVGVAEESLLVAGGANFPEKQLWEGGRKVWHDRIFALKPGESQWTLAGKLPTPLAYGVSVSTKEGILCAGGSDGEKHSLTVFLIQWKNEAITYRNLPPLPQPVAMAAGAMVGNVVYLAGGLETPQSKKAMNTFFSLDLENPQAGWRTLPSWPGRGRSQAVAASAGGNFYLFSGVCYESKTGGPPEMVYLADAYRYSPQGGWERLPDLPRPALAAASPAPVAQDTIFLIGGADGASAATPAHDFPLVPQRIQAFSIKTSSWVSGGNAPFGRVCVPTVEWQGRWILPSGERSAGVRTPEVWSLDFFPTQK